MKGWYADGVAFGDIILENSIETGYGVYGFFIGKFDTYGEPIWVKPISERNYGFDYNNMDVDNLGNVYFGAQATDTLLFGDNVYDPVEEDLFIAKYTSDGDLGWVKSLEGSGNSHIVSVCAMDTSAVHFAGIFSDKLKLDGELHLSSVRVGLIGMMGDYDVHGVEGHQARLFRKVCQS